MAPARKKSVNKRFLNEFSPEKEVRNSNKHKEPATGKKRLHNKLGPRWRDEELHKFYEAYRAHGADLKKIAAEVPNRSVEMVHALYRMNKVYLSLPEGIATVVGLIAMMTDHYNTLAVSDSEQENNDVLGVRRKPHKSRRTKSRPIMSKENLLQSHSIATSDGYLSLLKKGHLFGGQPRAVGKRTPRVPISRESYVSMKKCQRSENDANEEEGAHVAALALTEGLRRTEDFKSSPIRSSDMQASKGEPTQGPNTSQYVEGSGTIEVYRRGKKFDSNKVNGEEIWNSHSDDGGEACSGTEGPKVNAMSWNDNKDLNAQIGETSLEDQTQKTDNSFSGDEISALDALHALANISVMESESSVQFNEERTSLNVDDKSTIPEATSTSHYEDKIKLPRRKDKVRNAINEVGNSNSRKSKLGRRMEVNAKSVSESKPRSDNNNSTLKRKRHNVAPKSRNGEDAINSHHSIELKPEVEDEEIISAPKVKRICQSSVVSKQVKASASSEKASASEVVKSIAEVPDSTGICSPMRKTSRRKIDLKRALISKKQTPENIPKNQEIRQSNASEETALLKDKLSSSLSSPMVRRWCMFEWFYSAIDYPWFAKREFVEYLNHVGLGHMPTLTRVEWGVIRSSLGKPRRFSENFLREEREKLKLYRDSVRKHYTELRTGKREGLPTDLARPLTVGQRVIAVHPRTRELQDGSVLTVDHDCCRIQFDCPDMGVEFVKDIDCMPSNPVDNMPESLRRRMLPFAYNEVQMSGNPINLPATKHVMGNQVFTNYPGAQATSIDNVNSQQIVQSQPSAPAQLQAKEVALHALPELNRASDNKSSSAFPNSRKHGTNHKTMQPPWLKPAANYSSSGPLWSSVSAESECSVVEIVKGSQLRAKTMIDAAVQAISSMKEGEDPFAKIGEALDSIDQRQFSNNNPNEDTENTGSAIPSELITSCVSTLLMIQMCTERQYPPADVAQIIDSAVTSLHPCSSQNMPIYREIQMYMGRIKTQILALIPT